MDAAVEEAGFWSGIEGDGRLGRGQNACVRRSGLRIDPRRLQRAALKTAALHLILRQTIAL